MKKVNLLLSACVGAGQLWGQTTVCTVADAGVDVFDATNSVTIGPSVVAPNTTYSWSPATLLSDPNVANPTVIAPPEGGTYTYTLTTRPSTAINLITNGDFSLGNTGFSSQYTYISPGTLGAARQYTITASPRVMNSQWCETTYTGNAMAIDGATMANVPFWSQTVAVRPNTNHIFSYQAMLLYASNFDLGVSINGVPVSTRAPKGVCLWTSVSFVWNSGSATTANITLYSLSNVSVGNDFAIDNIRMLQPCPQTTDIVTINFREPCGNLVTNGDFSQGNTGFTTQYTYIAPGTAGTQGRYTITPNPRVMNGQWCTYSGTDNVMAIDGHGVANTPFWQQTIMVTPNTSYSFGFEGILLWPDNFTIGASINGVAVATQALTVNCARQPVSLTWNSGSSTSAMIRIYSTATKSVGNDFAIDNVRFARICAAAANEVTSETVGAGEVGVYPNPAQREVMIQLGRDTQGWIEIRDRTNSVVRTAVGEGNVVVDVAELPRGIYTVLVRSGEGVVMRRLVVE